MPGAALKALKAGSQRVVTHGGFDYLIKAITPRDLMSHTAEFLAHLDIAAATAAGTDPDAALETLASLTPQHAGQKGQTMEAVVLRGVQGIRPAGDEDWDLVLLVMTEGEASEMDPDAPGAYDYDGLQPGQRDTYPRLWVGELPGGAVEFLFNEIFRLSSDGERGAEALRNFRGRSDGSGNRRSNRKKAG